MGSLLPLGLAVVVSSLEDSLLPRGFSPPLLWFEFYNTVLMLGRRLKRVVV
jgi:hypothetical protein